MGNIWFPVVASLLVFFAIIVIGVRAQQYKSEASKRRSLAMVSGYASSNVSEAIAQVEQRDSIIRTSVLSIGYRLVPQKSRDKLAARIVQSGDTRGATVVDEQIIKKVEFGLVGLLLGLLLGFASGGLSRARRDLRDFVMMPCRAQPTEPILWAFSDHSVKPR